MEMKENVKFATDGELIWKQVLLPDETKVASLLFKKNNEVLHFHPEKVTLEIQVPILNNAKAFKSKIDAFSGQTIEEIKSFIVKSLIPKASKSLPFQLIFKGARLAGNSYLGDLAISDGSLLHLAKISDAAILVHLQNDSGAYFDLRLKPSMKIEDLKKMIHSKRDYPVEHQVLRFNKTTLQNDLCLHEYDVVSGANLDIFLQDYTIKIYDSVQKKEIAMVVKASDTVKKVKGRLNIVIGVQSEDQTLSLGDEILQDLSILCEIGLVEEGGKLDLSYDPNVIDEPGSKVINFMVRSYTGGIIHFRALPSTRIGKIKARLERDEGVEADKQNLIFEGKRLDDYSTLQDRE